jgi:hypothetical protein
VEAVLVLNADLGPLHRVSLKHAIRMLWRQVAEVHEAEPDRLIGVFPVPRVVRLVHYVVTKWRYSAGPAWSRAGVLARDGHRCGYCGGAASTVDHITPRSRGGHNTLAQHRGPPVAAATSARMTAPPPRRACVLRIKPAAPTWATLIQR